IPTSTLRLHDALPILPAGAAQCRGQIHPNVLKCEVARNERPRATDAKTAAGEPCKCAEGCRARLHDVMRAPSRLPSPSVARSVRSEEHTSELQSPDHL